MIDERLAVQLDVMIGAINSAMSFVDGYSVEQFLADEKTKAAVMMSLIRIGEAAARIERDFPEFVVEHSDWPWTEMRGMRNRGVHSYDRVNFAIVWDTLRSSLPALRDQLGQLGPLDRRPQP